MLRTILRMPPVCHHSLPTSDYDSFENADLRAYLLARRESLCGVHANLTSALAEVKTAKDMVFGEHPSPF